MDDLDDFICGAYGVSASAVAKPAPAPVAKSKKLAKKKLASSSEKKAEKTAGPKDKATPANLDDRLEAVYEDSCLTKPSRSFSDVDGESGAEWLQSKLMPLTCHCAWEVGHAAGTACLDCLTCSSYPQVSTIYL